MKTVKAILNYGGYVGVDEEFEVEVADDATEDEIDAVLYEEFKQIVLDNCSYEIEEQEEDEDEDDEEM